MPTYSTDGCPVPYVTVYMDNGEVYECYLTYAQWLGRQYDSTRIIFTSSTTISLIVCLTQLILLTKAYWGWNMRSMQYLLHWRLLIFYVFLLLQLIDPLQYDIIISNKLESLFSDLAAMMIFSIALTIAFTWVCAYGSAHGYKGSVVRTIERFLHAAAAIVFPMPWILYDTGILVYWQYYIFRCSIIIAYCFIFLVPNLYWGRKIHDHFVNMGPQRPYNVYDLHDSDIAALKRAQRVYLLLYTSSVLAFLVVVYLVFTIIETNTYRYEMTAESHPVEIAATGLQQVLGRILDILGIVGGIGVMYFYSGVKQKKTEPISSPRSSKRSNP